MKKLLATTALVAALFAGAQSANALPITLGYQVNGGTIANLGSNEAMLSYTGLPDATTMLVALTGVGSPINPQPRLASSLAEITENCNGCTVNLFVTEQGLTTPLGLADFIINPDWLGESGNVTSTHFDTWVDSANGLFDSGTEIESFAVNQVTNGLQLPLLLNVPTGSGPFSETTEFSFTFGDCSGTTCTADVQQAVNAIPAPTPAPLSLLGFGLVALAFLTRRRGFQN